MTSLHAPTRRWSGEAGSANDITRAVRDRLTAFRGETKSVDDVTFVVVKIVAPETAAR